MRDKVVVGRGVRKRSRKRRGIVPVKDDHSTAALCRNKGWLPLSIVVIEAEAKIEFPPKIPNSDKVILLVETSQRRSYSCIENDPDIPSQLALAGVERGHGDVDDKGGDVVMSRAESSQFNKDRGCHGFSGWIALCKRIRSTDHSFPGHAGPF